MAEARDHTHRCGTGRTERSSSSLTPNGPPRTPPLTAYFRQPKNQLASFRVTTLASSAPPIRVSCATTSPHTLRSLLLSACTCSLTTPDVSSSCSLLLGFFPLRPHHLLLRLQSPKLLSLLPQGSDHWRSVAWQRAGRRVMPTSTWKSWPPHWAATSPSTKGSMWG